MIPGADVILGAASAFVGTLFVQEPNEKSVRAAVVHARELATNEINEPAAVFYAFACRPRAFGDGWRFMTAFLTRDQLQSAGFDLCVGLAALDQPRQAVARREMNYEQVRTWFEERTEAIF